MIVEIQLTETSQPIIHNDVKNSYQKGQLYCVYLESGWVYKYPINNIWRIKESY